MIRKWDKSKPPTGPFTLNRDCPQAQGLVAWYPMGMASGSLYMPDYAGTYHMAGVGSVPMSIGKYGEPVAKFTGSASNAFKSGVAAEESPPLTITCRCVPTASQTSVPFALSKASGDFDYRFLVIIAGPGSVRMQSQQSGVAGTEIAETTWTYSIGAQLDIVGTVVSTTVSHVWTNGRNKATSSGTYATNPTGLTATQIGRTENLTNGPRLPFTGTIGECCVYNRSFDNIDAALHADPGQRFELWYPLRSRKWISTAAATAPSITALSARLITATSAQPRISYS